MLARNPRIKDLAMTTNGVLLAAHEKGLNGIEAVRQVGFKRTKIDTVVMRGTNEDELVDLLEYGKRMGAEVRFIEYMDVGGATQWSMDEVFSRAEILDVLSHTATGTPESEGLI